jgi:hypothetical protein
VDIERSPPLEPRVECVVKRQIEKLCKQHSKQRERRLNGTTRNLIGSKFFCQSRGKIHGGDLTESQAYRKQFDEINPDLYLQGDMQGMVSRSVLAKTKTFMRNKEKLSKNVIEDLTLRNIQWEKEKPGTGIVAGISAQPFSVVLFIPPALSVLKSQNRLAKRLGKLLRVYFDATYHARRVYERAMLHHCFVIPIRTAAKDKHTSLINVFEVVTDSSTTHSIECGLSRVRDQYRALSNEKMADVITTDKDMAAIGALLGTFNRTTTSKYLMIHRKRRQMKMILS